MSKVVPFYIQYLGFLYKIEVSSSIVVFFFFIKWKHCMLNAFSCSDFLGFYDWEPMSIWFTFIYLWTRLCFLAQDVPASSCSFLIPDLELAVWARNPGPFQWKTVFKSQDLGASFALWYWGVITPWPSEWTEVGTRRSVRVWVCARDMEWDIYTCVYTCHGPNVCVPLICMLKP